jgi:hypothetical protein
MDLLLLMHIYCDLSVLKSREALLDGWVEACVW